MLKIFKNCSNNRKDRTAATLRALIIDSINSARSDNDEKPLSFKENPKAKYIDIASWKIIQIIEITYDQESQRIQRKRSESSKE